MYMRVYVRAPGLFIGLQVDRAWKLVCFIIINYFSVQIEGHGTGDV